MKIRKFLAALMVLALLMSIPVAASAAGSYTATLNVNWSDRSSQSITGAGTYTFTADLTWDEQVQYCAITIPDAYSALSSCSATMKVAAGEEVLYDGWVGLYAQWVDDGTGTYVESNNCYIELYASWNGSNLVEAIPGGGSLTITLTITGELSGSVEEPSEEPENTNVYVVAGVSGLCGSEWNATDSANQMSDADGDGVYTITYANVAPGSYEFKVVENGEKWLCNDGWNNEIFVVGEACDVTISYDSNSGVISVSGSGIVTETAVDSYIVAGVDALCGSNWDGGDVNNKMTDEDGDGIYTITYTGVEAGSYEFKVVENLSNGNRNWLSNDGNNMVVNVEETADVTISYDTATGLISISVGGVTVEVTVDSYIVAGMAGLCGSEWDAGDANNQMLDEDGDGVYTITYTGVEAGSYEFKVVENLSNGNRNWLSANSDGSNMVAAVEEKSDVTISYNTATGEITVTVEPVATESTTAPRPTFVAKLGYADADWWPQEWGETCTTTVCGPGTYTLSYTPSDAAEGAMVLVVDIVGGYKDLSGCTVTDLTITVDGVDVPVDVSKVLYGDLEWNGNYRIEIYNEYGGTSGNAGLDLSQLKFSENMTITFTLHSSNAQTGDEMNIALLCGTLIVSAMGITALTIARKKYI